MKNAFKNSNSSRFNSLKEDDDDKWERVNEKERKRENNQRSNYNNFKSSNSKKPKTFVLDESAFPAMGTTENKKPLNENMDYLNKTKVDPLLNAFDSLEKEEIPEGIILLKYENGNIIWKNERKPVDEIEENDYERNNNIINKLVENYENYIQAYDELWGEGEYDKKYKSENHDSDYFDRLDQEEKEEYVNWQSDMEDRENSDYY